MGIPVMYVYDNYIHHRKSCHYEIHKTSISKAFKFLKQDNGESIYSCIIGFLFRNSASRHDGRARDKESMRSNRFPLRSRKVNFEFALKVSSLKLLSVSEFSAKKKERDN
jgi:hypothetical protein